MTLQEIITLLLSNKGFWPVVALGLLTLIEITPIKFNPWSGIAKWLGRAFNKEIIEKMDNLQSEINLLKDSVADVKLDMTSFREDEDERNATACRTRILRFGDEILHGVPHSKEHYCQIFLDIKEYEDYCTDHPKYKNNIAIATIAQIERKYQEHLEEDSFL